jgi:hypothetical protein
MSAANARASASRFAAENGERISTLRPPASTLRGNRRWSVFTHVRRPVAFGVMVALAGRDGHETVTDPPYARSRKTTTEGLPTGTY